MELAFSLAVLGFGLGVASIWVGYRWSKLKPELFPRSKDNHSNQAEQTRIAGPERVNLLFSGARTMLEKEGPAEAQIAIAVLKNLESAPKGIAAAIHALFTQALDTAEVCSLLLKLNGLYAYIIAIPNRHEHAHLLRRYPGFSAGWRYHAETIRASLVESSEFAGFATILFFLSPENKGSTALISCGDRDHLLLPAALVQGEDQKVPGVTTFGASYDFSLAA